jgi:ABC-type amino acid transport system permease subunit
MWGDFAFATMLALFVTLVLATAIFIFSRSDSNKSVFGKGVTTTLVVAGLMIWLATLWFMVSTGTRLPALP